MYSVYPPKSATATTTDFSSIGQKNSKKKPNTIEKFATKTIKKSGITGNHNGEVDIVLQIIENSQERVGSNSTGELFLWSYTPDVKINYLSPSPSTSVPENTNDGTEINKNIEVFKLNLLSILNKLLIYNL